jgi:hypothetical protein
MPLILATWERDWEDLGLRPVWVNSLQDPHLQNNQSKNRLEMWLSVEHLLSKHKALSSNSTSIYIYIYIYPEELGRSHGRGISLPEALG